MTVSIGLGLVGLGQSADALGWVGSHKMDPWTTLSVTTSLAAAKLHREAEKMNQFSVVCTAPS